MAPSGGPRDTTFGLDAGNCQRACSTSATLHLTARLGPFSSLIHHGFRTKPSHRNHGAHLCGKAMPPSSACVRGRAARCRGRTVNHAVPSYPGRVAVLLALLASPGRLGTADGFPSFLGRLNYGEVRRGLHVIPLGGDVAPASFPTLGVRPR